MNTVPVVAVLGYPIHHSKSPKMHGYWLDQAGVSGYYVPLEIHPDNFEAALKNMPKLGFAVQMLPSRTKSAHYRSRTLFQNVPSVSVRQTHCILMLMVRFTPTIQMDMDS